MAEPHPGAGCGSSLVEPTTAGGQAQHVPSHPSVPEHTVMLHSPSPGPALLPDSLAQAGVSVLAWPGSWFPPASLPVLPEGP